MRILFLTQVLPFPLDAGPKVRAYYTLRQLAREHAVTLLSLVRPSDSADAVSHLRTICEAVHTVPIRRSRARNGRDLAVSLLGREPFLVVRDAVPAMAAICAEMLSGEAPGLAGRPYDAVHADQLWMAQYALLAQRLAIAERPTMVLDQHNAVFQIPRRLAEWERNPMKRALLSLEARKLARYERLICRQLDHVVWVTAEDRLAVDSLPSPDEQLVGNDGNSSIIPICVDPGARPVIARRPNPRRVTFIGGLHWPPNAAGVAWFVREVWPQVRRSVPDARCTIIGKSPPRSLAVVNDPAAGVEVTGYVADPSPYLAETAVFVVPLQAGGGMRVKILDAWCSGLPVVTTRVGAEGIEVQDRQNVLLADSANSFAHAVVTVLREPSLAAHLSAEGRRTVEARYDWRTVYRAWDGVYRHRTEASRPMAPSAAINLAR